MSDVGVSEYLPGLTEDGEPAEIVDVTFFPRSQKTYVLKAKWWWKPICWIRRKPTTMKVTR